LFASNLLEQPQHWLDKASFPLDEITQSDWDTIERIVGNLYFQIMNPEIGAIFPYMTADPPLNCLVCDGSTYDRVDYPNLYAALDAVFIVDADTFIVPDMRSRSPIGAGEGTGLSEYAVGETGGEEQHQLTQAEMPSHSHSYSAPDISIPVVSPGEVFVPSFDFLPNATGNTGGDDPHETRHPFLALNLCVRAQ